MSILSKHHNGNSDLPRVRFQIGGALTDSSRALQACGRPPLHLSRKRGRTLAGNMMTAFAVHFRRMQQADEGRPLAQSHSASLPPPLPVSEQMWERGRFTSGAKNRRRFVARRWPSELGLFGSRPPTFLSTGSNHCLQPCKARFKHISLRD